MLKNKSAFVAIVAIATVNVTLTTAHAQGAYTSPTGHFKTVQDLYFDCKGDAFLEEVCAKYISGVSDIMFAIRAVANHGRHQLDLGNGAMRLANMFDFCPTPNVTVDAEVQVFRDWAKENPKMWGHSMVAGVVWALQSTWPCT